MWVQLPTFASTPVRPRPKEADQAPGSAIISSFSKPASPERQVKPKTFQ
jgi:hypothetical protein